MKLNKTNRLLSALLSACLLFSCFAFYGSAEGKAVFTLSSDVTGETVELDDMVTFSVSAVNCPGIKAGTVFFAPSPSLTYVSSTLFGEDTEAELSEKFSGQYGITILEPTEPKTGDIADFCSITFRVTDLVDVSIALSLYECISAPNTEITYEITSSPLKYAVKTPDKPKITTESLTKGVLGIHYSIQLESDANAEFLSWDISNGALPSGLDILGSGEISGIPTEFGLFEFTVTASVCDTVTSDGKTLTLEILEKPEKLTLTEESKYTKDEDNGFLCKVVEKTTVADLIVNFENSEFVKVYDKDGKELAPGKYTGTGCTACLVDGETKMDTLTVVVLGDVSGDGMIGTLDYQMIRGHYTKKSVLTGAYLQSAYVSGKTYVGTLDYQMVRKHYLKTYNIFE